MDEDSESLYLWIDDGESPSAAFFERLLGSEQTSQKFSFPSLLSFFMPLASEAIPTFRTSAAGSNRPT
jgi:hypothetical protein